MTDQTIQDILYLIDAWERGADAKDYPNEIAVLRQSLADQKLADAFAEDFPNTWGKKKHTTPPSKPWVSLTDEEMEKATRMSVDELLDHIYENGTTTEGVGYRVNRIVKAIEAALRSKNT